MIPIRASAVADFFDCAARAEARHLLGKKTATSSKALLGKAVHASTAVYDASTIEGGGVTIDEAAGAAVDAIRRPGEDVIWDEHADAIEPIAIALHTKYCNVIAPQQDYVAVEVQCDALEISDLGIILTGSTDRVRKTELGHGITDIKTGKTAVSPDGKVKTHGHTFQMGVYELLAEHGTGIPITGSAQIVGLNTAKTDAAQRIATGYIFGARQVLIGDQDSPGVLEILSRMLKSGVFPGNPRSMFCHEKYCPIYNNCHFRK